jgi:NADP-dependent 3-hydroxy acid dehydrogenase YdfG
MRSRELGAIDVLVDNAVYQHTVESIDDLSDEQRDRTFWMNIHTYF